MIDYRVEFKKETGRVAFGGDNNIEEYVVWLEQKLQERDREITELKEKINMIIGI